MLRKDGYEAGAVAGVVREGDDGVDEDDDVDCHCGGRVERLWED